MAIGIASLDLAPRLRVVAAAYGIFTERLGFSDRANIILDENHRVTFVKVYSIKELPDIEEVLQARA